MKLSQSTSQPLIQAQHLRVEDRLENISLSVHAGEIVTVIGPNGAGKTTLLEALIGAIATQGSIARAPGLRVGYVPQRAVVNPFLPITVGYFLALGKVTLEGDEARTIIIDTGVAPLLEKPLQKLSGGQWQRVLLARALLRRPQLLLLDEPVQGVDVQGQVQLYAYLEQVRDRMGCGILLVSHDLHFVMAAAQRVICLNRHVCCEGKPEHVTQHQAFRELFGAQAERFIAPYAHHHDHAHDCVEGHS
jgi:zinc transport system ATP-binding protein